MYGGFAEEQLTKAEYLFRYKIRASMVSSMISKYANSSESLSILDLGSADGLLLNEMNAILPDNNYLGIELCKELVDKADNLPQNIKVIHGDIQRLDLVTSIRNDTYDIITAIATLEHLKDPIGTIRQIPDMLKPNGLLIITVPHPFWDRISIALRLEKESYHMSEMGKKEILKKIEMCGLTVVEYTKFMTAPLGVLPYFKISVSPSLAMNIDKVLWKMKLFNWLFVNQCVVARKD